MSSERARHQCHKKGCDTQAEWRLHVKMTLATAAGHSHDLDMRSTLICCDDHRSAAVDWIIDPHNLDCIASGLIAEGFRMPHPETFKFEFAKLRQTAPVQVNVRRIATCDRAGCVMPAKHQVALRLWAFGADVTRARPMVALTNVCVCARHGKDLRCDDMLDLSGKANVLSDLTSRGLAMPDFRTAQLQFVPVKGWKKADPALFEKATA